MCLGWQGLLREQGPDLLTRRRKPGPVGPARIADLVGASRDDLDADMRLRDVTRLLPAGCRLALTDGYHGGRLLSVTAGHRRARRTLVRGPPARVVDPTGAGDVFLAALLAAFVRPDLTGRTGGPRPDAGSRVRGRGCLVRRRGPGLLGVPERSAVLARLGRT